jgi:hypothetical protein
VEELAGTIEAITENNEIIRAVLRRQESTEDGELIRETIHI